MCDNFFHIFFNLAASLVVALDVLRQEVEGQLLGEDDASQLHPEAVGAPPQASSICFSVF